MTRNVWHPEKGDDIVWSTWRHVAGYLPEHSLTNYAEHQVGASYGAFPPKIASSINCSIEEGEQIFNAYHKELYPKITEYRENYVLPTAKQHKKLHLGLGFYINTKDPDSDIRTLANA